MMSIFLSDAANTCCKSLMQQIPSANLLVPVLQDTFLGDLVDEISMQTAATEAAYAAAQATAAQLLQVSKDQYIRLNADFDNFRRRTVCHQAALFKHDIQSLPTPMLQADSPEHVVHRQALSCLATHWHAYMFRCMCSVPGLWYEHINCLSVTHNRHSQCWSEGRCAAVISATCSRANCDQCKPSVFLRLKMQNWQQHTQ